MSNPKLTVAEQPDLMRRKQGSADGRRRTV